MVWDIRYISSEILKALEKQSIYMQILFINEKKAMSSEIFVKD